MRSAERRKMSVLEMKCLRSLVGLSRMDIFRNEEVRVRAGMEKELASRTDQRVLRWFGHVERIDQYNAVGTSTPSYRHFLAIIPKSSIQQTRRYMSLIDSVYHILHQLPLATPGT